MNKPTKEKLTKEALSNAVEYGVEASGMSLSQFLEEIVGITKAEYLELTE